jgi:hypothetical protein
MTPHVEPPFGVSGLGWTLIVLAWLPLCAWLLVAIGRSLRGRRWKWLALSLIAFVMLAIPLGDDAYIQWRFNRLCRDAGIHIKRTVEVEGYYDDTMTGPSTAGPVTNPQMVESRERSGFAFLERRAGNRPGKYSHVEKIGDTWHVTLLDRPTARYHFKFTHHHERIGTALTIYEQVILDTHTGEIIARKTVYTRYPGWVDWLWLRFFDQRGKQCPPSGKQGYLPTLVFIPSGKL